jgi:fatty acid desaturase
MPIPQRLNLLLCLSVFILAGFLLWLASRLNHPVLVLLIGVVFSYVLLTNYALLHEASHGNLHNSSVGNYLLGLFTGALFPMSFTLMRSTHQGHHDHNRTDVEMFDLYYPEDNRFTKYVRWYGILCGFFWPLVPVGSIVFCLSPGFIRNRVFGRFKPRGYLINGIRDAAVWLVRLETGMIILLFWGLFVLLDLKWQNSMVLYACFAFNWSTRQYIGHAFSKRDILEGAWNLKHNRLMSYVLLHSEYDLNHHRHPEVPWYYLPRFRASESQTRSYVAQYWRQWLGPRLSTEPEPVRTSSIGDEGK